MLGTRTDVTVDRNGKRRSIGIQDVDVDVVGQVAAALDESTAGRRSTPGRNVICCPLL